MSNKELKEEIKLRLIEYGIEVNKISIYGKTRHIDISIGNTYEGMDTIAIIRLVVSELYDYKKFTLEI